MRRGRRGRRVRVRRGRRTRPHERVWQSRGLERPRARSQILGRAQRESTFPFRVRVEPTPQQQQQPEIQGQETSEKTRRRVQIAAISRTHAAFYAPALGSPLASARSAARLGSIHAGRGFVREPDRCSRCGSLCSVSTHENLPRAATGRIESQPVELGIAFAQATKRAVLQSTIKVVESVVSESAGTGRTAGHFAECGLARTGQFDAERFFQDDRRGVFDREQRKSVSGGRFIVGSKSLMD
jgi:hypothetical protein